MLIILVKKEVLDHLLSSRFAILAVLSALFIWIGLHSGVRTYLEQMEEYGIARRQTRERLDQMINADRRLVYDKFYWGEIYGRGFQVNRPVPVLSAFALGLQLTSARTYPTGGNLSLRFNRSAAADEPILELFPPLDLVSVVQVVLGLFALLLTYDTVSGEKEAATLRLTTSFSVPRYRLLIAKFLGAFLSAAMAFLPPFLIGLAVIVLPRVDLAASDWLRFGLILLTSAAYLSALVCAGILASTLTRQASTSLVLLLGLWALTVVLIPKMSLVAADALRPVPTVTEFTEFTRESQMEFYRERSTLDSAWAANYADSAGEAYTESPEGYEAFYQHRQRISHEGREKARRRRTALERDFRNRYQAWLTLAQTLARVSPSFALHNASVRLAGTGVEAVRRFEQACIRYGERLEDWATDTFTRDQVRRAIPARHGDFEWGISDIPRFEFEMRATAEFIQQALVDLGVVVLWALTFFAGAVVAFLRYDVR